MNKDKFKIAIDYDAVKSLESIAFFAFMTNALVKDVKIYILGIDEENTEKVDLFNALRQCDIKYSELVFVDDREKFILDNDINVLFTTDDSKLIDVPDSVSVFISRTLHNFDFVENE